MFVQSLNEVIDLHAKRLMVSLRSRIPLVIWAGLFFLTILGTASMGYQAGLSTTRRSPAMLGLVLAFGVVLTLIADLDRAQEGLLRISQGIHAYLEEQGVPHVWHVDGHGHDPTEWRNNLYHFAQRIFR